MNKHEKAVIEAARTAVADWGSAAARGGLAYALRLLDDAHRARVDWAPVKDAPGYRRAQLGQLCARLLPPLNAGSGWLWTVKRADTTIASSAFPGPALSFVRARRQAEDALFAAAREAVKP